MSEQRTRLAAIDIGTNSIHLIVVGVDPASGRFKIFDRERDMVRLGVGPGDMKSLSKSAMKRGIETLKRFKRIADAAHAPVRAVATSAVREAQNRDEFIHRVKTQTGIDIEIVSGPEEARLIYLGVLQALPVFSKEILMIDIGGGSTEFLVGKMRKIYYDRSLKLGAIRLTERFFRSGEATGESIRECREYIRGTLNPVSRAVHRYKASVVVGSSGTIESIAKMIQSAGDQPVPSSMNAFTITRDDLFDIVDKVVAAKKFKQRLKMKGLDPSRADIILAGALILEQSFKELKIKKMVVSEFALREGIIYDSIEKKYKRANYHNLRDIRYGSVVRLAESFMYEKLHSHHVAKLALQIFDQTKGIHGLGSKERESLDAASILHEIGLFLSHDNHHLHSYYLVRNAELLGFNEHEKEVIANIARYHRKSHPKMKHENYRNLSADDQAVVRMLASMLRIADGLDRRHSAAVAGLRCRISRRAVSISLIPADHVPIELERWGANRKKELFEETFGREVKIGVHR